MLLLFVGQLGPRSGLVLLVFDGLGQAACQGTIRVDIQEPLVGQIGQRLHIFRVLKQLRGVAAILLEQVPELRLAFHALLGLAQPVQAFRRVQVFLKRHIGWRRRKAVKTHGGLSPGSRAGQKPNPEHEPSWPAAIVHEPFPALGVAVAERKRRAWWASNTRQVPIVIM